MKQEGYFVIDHRDSPGFTPAEAKAFGRTAGSTLFEAATMWCPHCTTPVIKNPDRTRARAHCYKCDHFICDGCEWESRQPGYIHAPLIS